MSNLLNSDILFEIGAKYSFTPRTLKNKAEFFIFSHWLNGRLKRAFTSSDGANYYEYTRSENIKYVNLYLEACKYHKISDTDLFKALTGDK